MNKTSAMAPVGAALVRETFAVPDGLLTTEFRLRALTVHDLLRDFEAVTSSSEHLRSLDPGSQWPEGLTLEQNLIDLGWHQKEFQRRSSFAYTVVDPDDRKTLGCVYIYPSADPELDAEVFLWARQSTLASGLEQRLLAVVQQWVAKDWPFSAVAYPGRES